MTDAIDEFCNAKEPYTIDYSIEAENAHTRGIDMTEALIDRVEKDHATEFTAYEDLGGLVVYFQEQKIVGFYDYERFCGRFV